MKRQTKKRLKLGLWLLIVGAFISLMIAAPPLPKTPKTPVAPSYTLPKNITLNLPPLPRWVPTVPNEFLPQENEQAPQPTVGDKPFYQMEEPLPPPILEKRTEKPIPLPRPHDGRIKIAILIDDVGLSGPLSQRAVRLPAPVTLAYLPYAPQLATQAAKAQMAGHEIMLHMPMQPLGHENPGPNALLINQSAQEWRDRLKKALSTYNGFSGLNNHMGSRFTENNDGMTTVASFLAENGLFFVDSRTSHNSVAGNVMRAQGVPLAERDIFLDHTVSSPSIRAALAQTEQTARRKGSALAIGHPHPETLSALEIWIPEAQARGIEIVPVSQLVR